MLCSVCLCSAVFGHISDTSETRGGVSNIRSKPMARRIKDSTLDSREARRRLNVRGKPYWRLIEQGTHLGYRRLGGGQAGTWCVRQYVGDQEYKVEKIGIADDMSDADGIKVLNFWQAQTAAREAMVGRAHRTHGGYGSYTVGNALDEYLQYLERERKSAATTRPSIEGLIRPKLGHIEVSKLTKEVIEGWRNDLADAPARTRTRAGMEQNFLVDRRGEDARRARRATANRVLTMLKAALNRAWRDGKVPSNTAWTRVDPFKGVGKARVRYLTVAEAKRLINAADRDFRQLATAALQTGCRYGELTALRVHDYNPDANTLAITQGKSGKGRHVVLTDEGSTFFCQVCAGRPGSTVMLMKADGQPWQRSEQVPLMKQTCARAKILPPINFHALRHTWASLSVMGGMPLMVVAKNLGHRDTRMVELHYGHLAPSYVADAVREHAPRFGFRPDKKITPLAGTR
jgi:integrase